MSPWAQGRLTQGYRAPTSLPGGKGAGGAARCRTALERPFPESVLDTRGQIQPGCNTVGAYGVTPGIAVVSLLWQDVMPGSYRKWPCSQQNL